MGEDEIDSERSVNLVLARFKEKGLTVNPAKCRFNQKEVTFFGLKFSSEGVALKEEKIKALKEFKTPNNAAELTSFLGLAVYASRWIPDLATKSEPLRKLTRSKEKWYWDSTLQEILDDIKYSIIKSVSYFD
jgi:hypothetical protein